MFVGGKIGFEMSLTLRDSVITIESKPMSSSVRSAWELVEIFSEGTNIVM